MSSSVTVALLAVLTTAGLVAAAVTDGPLSIALAVVTVVVAAGLAWRLRSAPPGAASVAAFVTGIVIVSAGLPALAIAGDWSQITSSSSQSGHGSVDRSAELRRALDRAAESLPGGADAILSIDIDGISTQVAVLDLQKGEQVSSSYSQSGGGWTALTRTRVNDRADAVFRRADIAGLDLSAASAKVDAAARSAGLDLSKRWEADGVVLARRSSDKKLVATYDVTSRFKFETDGAGNLPDNLSLATVDGLLPVAERLLRANGFDPTKQQIEEISYHAMSESASAVGFPHHGTVELEVTRPGKRGTVTESIGRFPEARLYDSDGSGSGRFALTTLSAAAIEKARADVEQRSRVPAVDAHAVSLRVARDTDSPGWTRGDLPPVLQLGLGPTSKDSAYYRMDGTFLRSAS
ncbi:hypothetical protein FK268_13965 [Tsukamurella sputi]|uniref:Uncharacterized protein n=1 Tax=Tsukamurella sputi TaxID=2591848 RepID=A0A5C5RMH7_9ACTN|nr:hypothetical protein [Tsukamurella sputi]TWS23391.1 hypothetical protein FK268_13965 [Tsukamurella sputi]